MDLSEWEESLSADPNKMSLQEFISLPTTVPFQSFYNGHFRRFVAERPYIRVGTVISNSFAIAYTNQAYLNDILQELGETFTDVHVTGLTLLDSASLDAASITPVQQFPNINLKGAGVLLGFVDTGIDYTQSSFQYEDGSSKIAYIWDQTLIGHPPENMGFGAVYTQDEINQALQSPNPFDVVPQRDTDGHGTFLASVAGGRDYGEYRGAAPDAEIIAVKLKPISPFYLATTSTPADNPNVFGSSDIMLGIQFIIDKAAELNRPVAICIALGTNFGSHSGFSLMEQYLSWITNSRGVVVCTAAGNESNAKHHADGVIVRTGDQADVGIRVSGEVESFSTYILTEQWDRILFAIQSPTGETVRNIPLNNNASFRKTLVLERSLVSISFFSEKKNITLVRVDSPTVGIWQISLMGRSIISGEYHIWLPITGMISPEVEFIQPQPNYTIVSPATALGTITCGAYDSHNNSLYAASSWGPTCLPWMAPDLVAPGVNVGGIYPDGPGTMSGTSVAAALTTGATAIMLQWGIVGKNDPDMDCSQVRALLIAGCTRDTAREYPNVSWGYGRLNLLDAFKSLWE